MRTGITVHLNSTDRKRLQVHNARQVAHRLYEVIH